MKAETPRMYQKKKIQTNEPTYWLHSLMWCNEIRVGFISSSNSDGAPRPKPNPNAAKIGEHGIRMT